MAPSPPPPPAAPEAEVAESDLLRRLRPSRLILPVLIGLGVVGYLFWRSYTPGSLDSLADANYWWLLVTLLVLLARDVGYIYRIRYIADGALSWGQSFGVIVMWEFATCVLPSVAGGTAAAPAILTKEGIPLGKSLAYTMVTAMLDNLYYTFMVPLLLLVASAGLYPKDLDPTLFASLRVLFVVSYVAVTAYACLLLYALFVNPHSVRRLLVRLSSGRVFRRFRARAYRHGEEIVNASAELRGAGAAYWWRAVISTVFVWTARYAVIGCIIAAFVPLSSHEFLLVFARNISYKVVLLLAVTPGGSGIAEGAFPAFFEPFIKTAALTSFVVLFYRIVTYYFYLLVGLVYLPRWAGGSRKLRVKS